MKLPLQTVQHLQDKHVTRQIDPGIVPQGCNVGCLFSKAPHCIPKCISGDIAGCLACAGAAAYECGCI